jgi:aerobic carbon-monoxide dehydrogenase large subunit
MHRGWCRTTDPLADIWNAFDVDERYLPRKLALTSGKDGGKEEDTAMAIPPKFVGTPIKRREDPRLITGTATYVDDLHLLGMTYMAVLRSPYAHARIVRLDTQAARDDPRVLAVLTGDDIKEVPGPLPIGDVDLPNLKLPKHYPLAVGKVRHVGEAVAVVVATDRYAARDALELISVEYDPLPAVVEMEKALEPGAPVLHEEWNDNLAYTFAISTGDIDRAFREAEVTVHQRLLNQRLIPLAMEPRGVVAQYHAANRSLELWSSTQVPHILRNQLANTLHLAENRVRVIAPEVGGGFGSKANIYAEEALAASLAMRLRRPVKWAEERRENFMATIHGRDQIQDVEIAAKRDGTILGLRARVIADMGAYYQFFTPGIPTLTALLAPGCYKIPNFHFDLRGIFTNKTTTDAYRGAGRPEATHLIERAVDLLAAELKMDPVEVRRKNFPAPSEFPFATATGLLYDSGNYQASLDKLLELIDYRQFRAEQARLRQQGTYLGVGFSTYVEICGIGPSSAISTGGWESATVRVEPSGKVTVLTGASPHGQGQETSFAQIVADELGMDIEDVSIVHGDTAMVQYGIGTFGSRATAVGGAALMLSINKVKDKAKTLAAQLLEASPADIVFEEGKIYVRGSPDRAVTFLQVAKMAYRGLNLPPDTEPGLEASSSFEPSNFTFPFGAHACIVEVDGESGEIALKRYVAVDDCGRVINPLLVDGQVHGGIAQGLAQALFEEVVYDENGQLLTGTLMDYAVPKASFLPHFETDRTMTPSPVNPLGVKGVGEAGTIACSPAVVNAVVDALSHLGVRHIDMPLKPEKIWRILQEHRQSRR